MSVVLQPQLTKHSYFASETNLYYIEEIIDDDILIEDCVTYKLTWINRYHLEQMPIRSVDYERISTR